MRIDRYRLDKILKVVQYKARKSMKALIPDSARTEYVDRTISQISNAKIQYEISGRIYE